MQLELWPEAAVGLRARRSVGGLARVGHREFPSEGGQPAVGQGGMGRDRVTVDLRGLRARLEARAAMQGIKSAALVRRALVLMLDDCGSAHERVARPGTSSSGRVVKVTLRLPAEHAAMLAHRARAAEVAQGRYVCALLNGMPAPPIAPDRSASVAALRASTDRVAALSADLNALLRHLGRVPSQELEGCRAGLTALVADVRSHLARASSLVSDLTPARSFRL